MDNKNETLKSICTRIDERTQLLIVQMRAQESDLHDLRDQIHRDYVTQAEFKPIRSIVYGVVSLVLVSAVGAILSLIIH